MTPSTPAGCHIVADLRLCPAGLPVMVSADALRHAMSALIARHGLTPLTEAFHGFAGRNPGEPGGVTGCVVLAESHAAVHTWPELGMVTLDVHVCNVGVDNTEKARALGADLIALFEPGCVHRQEVKRGETWLLEPPLNDGLQYGLKADRRLLNLHTPWQHLEVYESRRLGRILRLDGAVQTSEGDEFFYHEPLVHTALAGLQAPASALVLGGGDGGSARQLLKYRSLQRVVLVELDAAVVEAARAFLPGVHAGALDDPRVEVVIADGADHVRHCSERFDLIVLDLPDPGGPCIQLYEPAFLRRCADLLTAGGRVSLHLGSAHADLPRLQRLHAGLASVFGTVRPFRVPIPLYGGEWLMAMCSPGPLPEASKQQIESGLQREGVAGLNYYNAEVHAASFALPNYLRRALEAEAAAAMQPAASAEVAA